jgi:hypothetical protein
MKKNVDGKLQSSLEKMKIVLEYVPHYLVYIVKQDVLPFKSFFYSTEV